MYNLYTIIIYNNGNIIKIQRHAERILYKLDRRTMVSILSLMHSLELLKFRLVCKFTLLCITHRAI